MLFAIFIISIVFSGCSQKLDDAGFMPNAVDDSNDSDDIIEDDTIEIEDSIEESFIEDDSSVEIGELI